MFRTFSTPQEFVKQKKLKELKEVVNYFNRTQPFDFDAIYC